MAPMLRRTVTAVLAAALFGALPSVQAKSTPQSTVDARVARCILDNMALARGKGSADLVAEACRALIEQAETDAQDGSITLVKCVVPGDPEWIEFRLLTRTQCSNAAGIAGS
jgi:hypothetical protein